MTQTQETSAPVTQVVIATPAPHPPKGRGHEFLGRPEPFDGVTARWKDWSVVCQTYLGETFWSALRFSSGHRGTGALH